jgi:hypothetical protein
LPEVLVSGFLLLDFEAASIGRVGYPIEVAWCVAEGGPVTASLIRPEAAWDVPGSWQPSAERVHGICRAELELRGRPAKSVAGELLAAAEGRDLLSDMPPVDVPLLRRLLSVVPGAAMPTVGDFWSVVRQHGSPELGNAAIVEADVRFPSRHRAASDVGKLAFIWGRMMGQGLLHSPTQKLRRPILDDSAASRPKAAFQRMERSMAAMTSNPW